MYATLSMLNKNKPILTCMLLHTNQNGDQRYWFTCNINYKSKSRLDTITALNKTLIEECRLRSANFCTGVVDGAIIENLNGNITIGSKNIDLLWDPPHLKGAIRKTKKSTFLGQMPNFGNFRLLRFLYLPDV